METTDFWRDLENRFRELRQEELPYSGQGALGALWDGHEWHLNDDPAHVRTNFERLAKSAAVRLGHAGGPTALFFWLDLLKAKSSAYHPFEPIPPVVKGSEGGRIELLCKVSAEYCVECETQEIAGKRANEYVASAMSGKPDQPGQPQSATATNGGEAVFRWDLFICHASEDKETFVRLLAEALRQKNLKVWYDEFTLTLGDSQRGSIDRGLKDSRFGVVVLSHAFFAKSWPQRELDGLLAQEKGRKVILPVLYNLTPDDVRSYSPTLAGRVAARSSEGIDTVVTKILDAIQGNR